MSEHDRRQFLKRTAAGIVASGAIASSGDAHAAAQGAPKTVDVAIPPHRGQVVPGVHGYAVPQSVRVGEPVAFHLSSTVPYELSICRLGPEVDDLVGDEVLTAFDPAEPCPQPIHPGSYIHVERGLPEGSLKAVSLECWIRPWRVDTWAGLITQYDYPDRCGLGLFVSPQGRVVLHLGDGGKYRAESSDTSDEMPLEVGRWQHVVATWDGRQVAIWIDGRQVNEARHESTVRPASVPLRLGAYGERGQADHFADVDLAMPCIYGRALSAAEVANRYEAQALVPAIGPEVWACWILDEERGAKVADSSGNGRDGTIINHATWMIGGPTFDANVSRYGDYDPLKDPQRGHGLRLSSDDLYDCRFAAIFEHPLPSDARPGIYVGRIKYELDGQSHVYHVPFFVRRAAGSEPAPVALLCATNTYRAYNAGGFAAPPPALKHSLGTGGLPNNPGNPPAFSFYRAHQAGQGTYQLGLNMPWRGADPYAIYGNPASDYSHLLRADRFTQVWLEANNYRYDVLTDLDLHRDDDALAGIRTLVISGHSEYWSREMYEAVERFLADGGTVVCLSGNTMFWRVSFDDDLAVLECRKVDAPGNQMPPERRGEAWHSDDGKRGGLMRECGLPGWRLIGLETLGWNNVEPEAFGSYVVKAPDHFLFRQPEDTGLARGDVFGEAPDGGLPRAIGHEFDVRVSTLREWSQQPPPEGAEHPDDPPGIALLADGVNHWSVGGTLFDYFTQPMSAPRDLGAEMIYWERPDGGRVFNAGAIGAGWAVASDPRFGRLLRNVFAHFSVHPENA